MRVTFVLTSVALFLPFAAFAQKDIKANTTGTCSPVVTGGSSQITINCNGMSAARANQLVVLMNRILSERLDLSEVNGKLDQLHADLGGLDAALHPMANLPQPVLAMLKQGDVLMTQCGNLVSEWSQRSMDTNVATVEGLAARRQADAQARSEAASSSTSTSSALDQQKASEFSRLYSPRLSALNATLHGLVPEAAPIADVSVPVSSTQAGSYAFSIQMLSKRYQQNQVQAGKPINGQLVNQVSNVFQDANRFCRDWIQAKSDMAQTARVTGRPAIRAGVQLPAVTNTFNSEQVDKYRQTLEPRLVSFRDAVMPQVPAYSSGRDYDAVATPMQLNGICQDVRTLSSAYRQKAVEEAEQKRVSGK